MSSILHRYRNGNYDIEIYEDGTKLRVTDSDVFRPDFPESMDLKITNRCTTGCEWCHEESHGHGRHSDPDYILSIVDGFPKGVELAIGGGDIMTYPHIFYLLERLTGMGFICNVTLNEKTFDTNWINGLITSGLVKGVGYSYFEKPCPIEREYEHVVNHIIIGLVSPDRISNTQKKLLLLGYKRKGRGANMNMVGIDENIRKWYRYLYRFFKENKYIIGLDNLAISQLNPKRLFVNESDYYKYYMGDDGDFTMYVDAVDRKFAKSSSSDVTHDITGNIMDCFNILRSRHDQTQT